jgi:hypothetical protein
LSWRRFQYQQFAAPVLVPVSPVLLEWFSPLSEPVQIEPGLSAAWTQYHGSVTVPAPLAVTFVPPALSEPIRIKQRALWEHYGNVTVTPAPVAVAYTLAVTETGDFATLQMMASERFAATAAVSISEAKVSFCEVSIREIEQ